MYISFCVVRWGIAFAIEIWTSGATWCGSVYGNTFWSHSLPLSLYICIYTRLSHFILVPSYIAFTIGLWAPPGLNLGWFSVWDHFRMCVSLSASLYTRVTCIASWDIAFTPPVVKASSLHVHCPPLLTSTILCTSTPLLVWPCVYIYMFV